MADLLVGELLSIDNVALLEILDVDGELMIKGKSECDPISKDKSEWSRDI